SSACWSIACFARSCRAACAATCSSTARSDARLADGDHGKRMATRKRLTAEQVRSYRADGFLFPLDARSPAEAQPYRAALDATPAELGGSLMDVDRKYRGNLHLLCCWMDELIRHPAILDAVEDLIGPDILLYPSRYFIKEPHTE